MLKRKLLEELRKIVEEEFDKNLNEKELFEFGNNLLSYFELLAKIHFRNRLENRNEKQNEVKFDSFTKRS